MDPDWSVAQGLETPVVDYDHFLLSSCVNSEQELDLMINKWDISSVIGYHFCNVTEDYNFCLASRLSFLLALMKQAAMLKKPTWQGTESCL